MEISEKLLEIFNGNIVNNNDIEFIGNNNGVAYYDGDNFYWQNRKYFNVINLNNVVVPELISVYSTIDEALHYHKSFIENEIIIISAEETAIELMDYLYSNFLVYSDRISNIIVYVAENRFSGILNLININNFFTNNKITYEIINQQLLIANNHFSYMRLDYNNLDNVLKPFLSALIYIKKIKQSILHNPINF